MTETPLLNRSHIFSIPAGAYFGRPDDAVCIVYAPLADSALIATPDNIRMMEQFLEGNTSVTDETIVQTMEALLDHEPLEKLVPRRESPEAFFRLPVLPNSICNFACSYCYSAKGRNGRVLKKDQLKTTLEVFIDPARISRKELVISFLGGGEPMLSWDLVKYGIEYASELAEKGGFTIDFSLVTNGSLINDEQLTLLKKHDVMVSVSFEILEEIQNMQRKNYNLVAGNLKRLLDAGINTRIRSTITTANVKLMTQMVEEVALKFRPVNNLMMEAVTDDGSFTDTDQLRAFYDDYTENFFAAMEAGEKHGIQVECSASRNINLLIERFCPGEFSLTPSGEISICTRISAPQDPGYADSIFGRIENGEMKIDREKYAWLLNDDVFRKEKCGSCFARFHCGGGCQAQQYIYSTEVQEVICDYTRNFVRRVLLERLEKQYAEYYGTSLKDAVAANPAI